MGVRTPALTFSTCPSNAPLSFPAGLFVYRAHGDLPVYGKFQIFFTLLNALITGITEYVGLVSMQEGLRLGDVLHVGGGVDHAMH